MAATLFKPDFKPGVVKNDTGLRNEGGYSDSDLVRFWQGLPQPIGGWQVDPQKFEGKARGIHSWSTLQGKSVLAFGTSSKLYAKVGGALRDITGPLHETTLDNALSTTNGSPIVTVNLPFHRLRWTSSVTFTNQQAAIGGITLDGSYPIVEILNPGQFTIDAGANASADVTNGGGFVDFQADLPAGYENTLADGYGTGPYGAGPYGVGSVATEDNSTDLRVWSLDNWGENLLANPSGYGLWEWQPEVSYLDLAFNGGFNDNANGWGLGTGWSYAAGKVSKATGTASNLSQNVDGVLEGGRVYRVIFTVERTAGSLKLRMNSGTPAAVINIGTASSAITRSGTYSRTFVAPPGPLDIVFEADATFVGSIDSVSYQLEDKAYRIDTAPSRMDAMFVDPRGLVVAVGTVQIDGVYNPTCVRCSDLGKNRSWIPDNDSLASEYVLRGGGGRLMAGLATRQQNLIWGDNGVFSLQYAGEAGNAFTINLLGTGCGLISRHSMAEQNGFVFWVANTKQFFIFRGLGSTSLGIPEIIPCTIREDVFDNLDLEQSLKVHAGINPAFSEVWFFFPDLRDAQIVDDQPIGECSRVAAFSWIEGHWVPHRIARTAWEPSGVFNNPVGLAPNGYAFEHETGTTANGAALNAWIETSDFDIEDGTNLMALTGIMPDFKAQTGDVRFTFKHRQYPQGPILEKDLPLSRPNSRRVLFRAMARQGRVRIASASTGAFWRLGAIRFEMQKTGAPR
jgi:hypothetical protein